MFSERRCLPSDSEGDDRIDEDLAYEDILGREPVRVSQRHAKQERDIVKVGSPVPGGPATEGRTVTKLVHKGLHGSVPVGLREKQSGTVDEHVPKRLRKGSPHGTWIRGVREVEFG